MTAGEAVKAIRQSLGQNQHRFAEQLGITRSTLARIESNELKPSRQVLVRLYTFSQHAQKRVEQAATELGDLLMQRTNLDTIWDPKTVSNPSSLEPFGITLAALGFLYLLSRDK